MKYEELSNRVIGCDIEGGRQLYRACLSQLTDNIWLNIKLNDDINYLYIDFLRALRVLRGNIIDSPIPSGTTLGKIAPGRVLRMVRHSRSVDGRRKNCNHEGHEEHEDRI